MSRLQWPLWPTFDKFDVQAVNDVIKSNQLFAADQVLRFESKFANYIGCKYSAGVGNATQGLHLALAALDIGIGDEVIVPNYSFISTASCVLMQNAIPIFVDLEPTTLAPTANQIEQLITEKTKAIIITHLWGFSAHIIKIQNLAKKYNIYLIEDASHAHGAIYQGKKLGSFSDISVFSLHQRKNLPVGDGGVCCTNDKRLFEKIYRLRSFGDSELSYNYRMTEFAGALGCSGLDKLDSNNAIRRDNAQMLDSYLNGFSWISFMKPIDGSVPVYHSYIIFLHLQHSQINLDFVVDQAKLKGIPLKKTWEPLHIHKHFNSDIAPARGLPWLIASGASSGIAYKDQSFPCGDSLIAESILQIDVHPGFNESHALCLHDFFVSLNRYI